MPLAELRDIKAPMPLPADAGGWWMLGGGLLALSLGLLLWWAFRRNGPDRHDERDLTLAGKRLLAEAAELDDVTFAARLAALLRRGLSRRTGIAAECLTMEEILPQLSASTLPPALQHRINGALQRAERRYAPLDASPPAPDIRHNDAQTACELIAWRRPWRG